MKGRWAAIVRSIEFLISPLALCGPSPLSHHETAFAGPFHVACVSAADLTGGPFSLNVGSMAEGAVTGAAGIPGETA
jgi:hypothetical protein